MIEIDFIPVGDEVKTGDAILFHFTEPGTGTDRLVLIDGGFADTSDDIIDHVTTWYRRSTIDMVICTHPDDDHINGLTGVFENFDVLNLIIHRPSEHGHTSDEVKSQKIEDLIALAESKGVKVITSAYAGQKWYGDAVMVAGPTLAFYEDALAEQTGLRAVAASLAGIVGSAVRAIAGALRPRADDPGEGTLTDNGGTTARNNSSIIIDVQVDGKRALFTGDAGVPALTAAADTLDAHGRSARLPDFFDIPHHGSRHNLDTAIANRLLGPIVGDTQERTAVVSVGKKADDFPRPEVANAVKRRGYHLVATRGKTVCWNQGYPARVGWTSIPPIEWLEV